MKTIALSLALAMAAPIGVPAHAGVVMQWNDAGAQTQPDGAAVGDIDPHAAERYGAALDAAWLAGRQEHGAEIHRADQWPLVVIETPVDTQLPGHIVAVVSSDTSAVMPMATRIVARYEPLEAADATRLPVCVMRIIPPDGKTVVAVQSEPSRECLGSFADADGRMGLSGTLTVHADAPPSLSIPGGSRARFVPASDLHAMTR